ncbi:MAG: excinuclease ABC subunit UvrA, partial [Candidatus Doudnabacteria bacterium]|nr:excinuclease ABC subunit UvrA [Candidatus Doudnabacteria bacterium]
MSQITIKGARVHNLKNINVSIPRDKLVVITGLSGSGKSSLAFDTIYAEGQRRYVESLSSYARQFLGIMDKPDVDRIDGLSPAISIDQRTASQNPRSTVGTVTEIYDYLRLLYARVGVVHCPKCGQEVSRQTTEQIVSKIMSLPERTRIMVLSPMVRDQKGEHKGVLEEAAKAGYLGARVDGALYEMGEAASARLDKNKKHNIEIVVDRLMIMGDKKDDYEKTRLTKAVEAALDMGNGLILVEITEEGWSAKNNKSKKGDIFIFSQHFSCPQCNIDLPEIEPRGFSFNSPHGACARCGGLGIKLEVDPKLVLPNPRLTLDQGAIRPWSKTVSNQAWYQKILKAVADKHCFSVDTPVGELSQKQIEIVLCGTGEEKYILGTTYSTFEGVIPNLEKRYKETDSDYIRQEIEKYMRVLKCPECDGKRLKKESLAVTFAGRNIAYVVNLTIENALKFFESLLNDKSVGGKKNVGTGEEMADFVG